VSNIPLLQELTFAVFPG